MKIHVALRRESERPLSLAIGFFDGLHAGHREVLRAALRMRKPGWRSGVLTFANHPAAFLRPGSEPPLLATPEERIDGFASLGFEECFFVPFDEHVATMAPREFLERLSDLGVRAVAVGETFRYGRARAGDAAQMRSYCNDAGIAFEGVASVTTDDDRVSSTRIRALVADGDLERAEALLGHAYELRGVVEMGAGRGHGLGFPTANLQTPKKLVPRDGIYSGVARYDGRDYAALISIGTNPQFRNGTRTIEAWLRDFRQTIYGKELALRDLRFVREQRVFPDVDQLVAQMHRDLEAVAYPSFS